MHSDRVHARGLSTYQRCTMTISILKQLRALQRDLNQHCQRINYGGCMVVAAQVARRLTERGIPCEIVTYSHDSPKDARAIHTNADCAGGTLRMHHWESQGVSFGHVAVRFRWRGRLYTFDSDALWRGGRTYGKQRGYDVNWPFGHGMTWREGWALARVPDGWNRTFKRGQIPTIVRLAAQHLQAA